MSVPSPQPTNPYVTELNVPRPAHLGERPWAVSGLTAITVLMGRNGSGKSLLLRQLREQNTDTFHYISPQRYGGLSYQSGYTDNQVTSQGRAGITSSNVAPEYHSGVVARIQVYLNMRVCSIFWSGPLRCSGMAHL
jgi:ABC-type molybdenum transport system ATPase subunit/photorepair protein PhrA